MQALVKNSAVPEDVTLREVAEPEPAPGQVRVRTQACGLCGSDVHAWRHDRGYEWITPPVALGHEAVGRVEALGEGVDQRWLGKRVVPVAIDGCGSCDLCKKGFPADLPAAQRSRIVLRRRCRRIIRRPRDPTGRGRRNAAGTDRRADRTVIGGLPGGCPRGERDGRSSQSRRVGARSDRHDGSIGAESARPRCRVDRRRQRPASRLPLARSLGLRTLVSGSDTLPFIPTGWVEASGSTQALDGAVATVLPGSPVAVVGLFAHTGGIDFNALTRKEIRLQGSYGSTRPDYDPPPRPWPPTRTRGRTSSLKSPLLTALKPCSAARAAKT